ncbi:uncharacterized protein LOC135837589 [Planococcus citri]
MRQQQESSSSSLPSSSSTSGTTPSNQPQNRPVAKIAAVSVRPIARVNRPPAPEPASNNVSRPQPHPRRLIPSTAYPSSSQRPSTAHPWGVPFTNVYSNMFFGPSLAAAPQQPVISTPQSMQTTVQNLYSLLRQPTSGSAPAPAPARQSALHRFYPPLSQVSVPAPGHQSTVENLNTFLRVSAQRSAPVPAPASAQQSNVQNVVVPPPRHSIQTSAPAPAPAHQSTVQNSNPLLRHSIQTSAPAQQSSAQNVALPLRQSTQTSVPAPALSSSSSGVSSASLNNIEEDSRSEDFDALIDGDTPQPISEMLLNAIEVRPYMLDGETRSPEVFVDQFETYADLLLLNDEQARVLFAKLAYVKDDLRFQALKFDSTYDDMKRNFLDMAYKGILKPSEKISKIVAPKKSGFIKRVRKLFRK